MDLRALGMQLIMLQGKVITEVFEKEDDECEDSEKLESLFSEIIEITSKYLD